MSDPVVIAGIVTAVIGLFGILLTNLYKQIADLRTEMRGLEGKLEKADSNNRSLWAYCRHLLDMYYIHRKEGAPDPPPLPDLDDM